MSVIKPKGTIIGLDLGRSDSSCAIVVSTEYGRIIVIEDITLNDAYNVDVAGFLEQHKMTPRLPPPCTTERPWLRRKKGRR